MIILFTSCFLRNHFYYTMEQKTTRKRQVDAYVDDMDMRLKRYRNCIVSIKQQMRDVELRLTQKEKDHSDMVIALSDMNNKIFHLDEQIANIKKDGDRILRATLQNNDHKRLIASDVVKLAERQHSQNISEQNINQHRINVMIRTRLTQEKELLLERDMDILRKRELYVEKQKRSHYIQHVNK